VSEGGLAFALEVLGMLPFSRVPMERDKALKGGERWEEIRKPSRHHHHRLSLIRYFISFPSRTPHCYRLGALSFSRPRRIHDITPSRSDTLEKDTAYLASRYELQWPQRRLHIRDVGLEVIQSCRDADFQLRRLLPRRAIRRNLVHCRHDG
jgi:hypothetical protein